MYRPPQKAHARTRTVAAALLATIAVMSSCGRGATSSDALPQDDTATVDEDQVAQQQLATIWNCGAVKQHVYAIVNALTAAEAGIDRKIQAVVAADAAREALAAADAESEDEVGDIAERAADALSDAIGTSNSDAAAGDDAELVMSVRAARSGFGPADQDALDASCELYGQHEAALELWATGNRGDACDVWAPAKASSDTARQAIDVTSLHPLVSKFWLGATGAISEGSGRCIAERAN